MNQVFSPPVSCSAHALWAAGGIVSNEKEDVRESGGRQLAVYQLPWDYCWIAAHLICIGFCTAAAPAS
ncbi:unnamed protein product [Sphagnum balticum]